MPAADPASVTLAVGNEDLLVDRVVASTRALSDATSTRPPRMRLRN
jgi:hypothetical protein